MQFKLDENVPIDLLTVFREAGHDALTAAQQRLNGSSDTVLAQRCREEGRVLVTLDLDFADLRAYPPADYPGIIVLRPARQDGVSVTNAMRRALPRLTEEPLEGRLWIVEDSRVRIRGDA